ncbi:MAG: chemotaxis response regulator protein-glutamate methylesterase [Planctomycetota bacterium]
MLRPIRVLIVDDSALVREILTKALAMDKSIEVVGDAQDPYEARDKIVRLTPDVMTLDVEMPRMDGVEFLRRLMPQYPIPVIMVSALTQKGKKITLDSLALGAVDFVAKPSGDLARGLTPMIAELLIKIKVAATVDLSYWKQVRANPQPCRPQPANNALPESTNKVIAIGASTGGTEAIKEVISRFPLNIPGVVIVQHMPAGFTNLYAETLNTQYKLQVKEAVTGDKVMPGRVLIAPGGKQMTVKRSGGEYRVNCFRDNKVCGHAPSVEVLMQSVAKNVGANAVGIILTGMGSDGAEGMLALREAGGRTLAQDEATSVVFGMPRMAWEKGGVEKLVPLGEMADEVIRILSRKSTPCKTI